MKPTCGHTHPDGPRSAGWAGSALFRPPAFGTQHSGLTEHPPQGPQPNRATGQLGCLDTLGLRALDVHPAGPQAPSPSRSSTPGYRWPLTTPSCPWAFRPAILPTPPSISHLLPSAPCSALGGHLFKTVSSGPAVDPSPLKSRQVVLPWTLNRTGSLSVVLTPPLLTTFFMKTILMGTPARLGLTGPEWVTQALLPGCRKGPGAPWGGVRGTALQGTLRTEDTEPGALLHTRDFIWTVSAAPTLGPSQAEPVGNATAPGVPALSPLLLLQELVLDVLVTGAAIRALLFLGKQIREREGLSVRLWKRRAVQLRAAALDAAPVPGASTQGTGRRDPPAPTPRDGHPACMSGAMSLPGTRACPPAAGSPLPAGSHGSGQCPFSSALSLYGVVSAAAGASLKAAQQSAHSRTRGQPGRTGGQARGAGTHGTNNVWGRAETFHPKYLQAFTHIKDSPSPGSELGK